ncbi:MAG: S24/S26 family peptidase [Candidatus Aminicenantes bacterium]|nr:S24/S26 family peptidase [Candidatus Aminicenantes bacterium]
MKSVESKPGLFVKKGEEVEFSAEAFVDLLKFVLEKKKGLRFRVRGFSMVPLIRDRDIVTVFPFSVKKARTGDVVIFRERESSVLAAHRIVKKGEKSFLLKGDNIDMADGYIPLNNILCSVSRVEREGKKIKLGMGATRNIIAILSREGIIHKILSWFRRVIHWFRRIKK